MYNKTKKATLQTQHNRDHLSANDGVFFWLCKARVIGVIRIVYETIRTIDRKGFVIYFFCLVPDTSLLYYNWILGCTCST